jgi:hypothetical protein
MVQETISVVCVVYQLGTHIILVVSGVGRLNFVGPLAP